MALLTDIAPDPRRSGYVWLEVDRQRFASLPVENVAALRLRAGTELGDDELARVRALADVEGAWRAALRVLATRARARADLRRRLIEKQHPPAAVDQALERLNARGLLDDRRFAVEYAARHGARGRGPSRLLGDLLAQGVERRVAEHGVADALAEEAFDPGQMVRAIAKRRAAQLAGLTPSVRKRRLLAFLARRGYRGSEAIGVVEELCGSP